MAMKRLPEIPIDPPPEYFAAVGEVAVRWSRLEYQLGVLVRVGFRLGKDEQRTLIVGMDMSVLTSILSAVAQGWVADRDLANDLKVLAKEIADLRTKRAEFVHGLFGHWLGQPKKWYMFRLKSRKQRGQIDADPISPGDISAFASTLRTLQLRAQDLTTRLKASHGTRP